MRDAPHQVYSTRVTISLQSGCNLDIFDCLNRKSDYPQTGVVASVLFVMTAAKIFLEEQLLPASAPLPFFGYAFLVLTFVGWIWKLLRTRTV